SRRAVWDAVRMYAADGGAVLLTTHHLEEAETLATRIAVLAAGAIVAQGSPAEIRGVAGLRRVRVRAGALPPLPDVVRARSDAGLWSLDVRDAGAVVEALVRARVPLRELEVAPLSLEEAFLRLTAEPP